MNNGTAVAERQDQAVVEHPASDSATLIQIISRVASDPAADIDKMERLMQMHERLIARDAKTAYAAALAEMQPKLPVIERKGNIVIHKKDQPKTAENVIQSTPYALWEDINEAIRPLLSEHRFALSFRVKKDADRVEVTGVLSHGDGHSEETTLSLPMDTTGSKNNVQAIGSSVSYGKRYTASALLNITTRGDDDDGKSAGDPGTISAEQLAELNKLLADAKVPVEDFCAYAKIETLADLPAAKFDLAKQRIQNRKNGGSK